jgi:hypothetical protein
MRIIESLQERFSTADEVDGPQASESDNGSLPIPGYDRFKEKELIAELPKHTQSELTAIDAYESSHKDRPAVFDKLRYLRGPEPLQNYDALSTEDLVAGLQEADLQTLHRTRVYERKFRRRTDVLETVAAGIHERNPSNARRG